MTALALPSSAQLSDADEAAMSELYRRGTPPNTLRAWERDLAYISAWKRTAFGKPLVWPEEEQVALRFILDHRRIGQTGPGDLGSAHCQLAGVSPVSKSDRPLPQSRFQSNSLNRRATAISSLRRSRA